MVYKFVIPYLISIPKKKTNAEVAFSYTCKSFGVMAGSAIQWRWWLQRRLCKFDVKIIPTKLYYSQIEIYIYYN